LSRKDDMGGTLLEASIRNELVSKGWEVDSQVGCSEYRIDLAVRDPDFPGRYLLGIECDGVNYKNAKTARDRDWIRKSVLENLGWRLHRIWSTDWWLQRSKEIEKLESTLEEARRTKGREDIRRTEQEVVPVTVAEPQEVTGFEENHLLKTSASSESPSLDCDSRLFDDESNSAELPGQRLYKVYIPDVEPENEDIHNPGSMKTIREIVQKTVQIEGPLLIDRLASVVAECWGLKRAGKRIRSIVRDAVKREKLLLQKEGNREFVMTPNTASGRYKGFRVPDDHSEYSRQAHEIWPDEIANAACEILRIHISINVEDLARETANLFGIRRLGANVRSCFMEGIKRLEQDNRCRLEGDNMLVK